MKMTISDKITRTITVRKIEYAYLTDHLEVEYGEGVFFGTEVANLPEGAKIVRTSEKTFKCSMDLQKFFELSEKEEIEQ